MIQAMSPQRCEFCRRYSELGSGRTLDRSPFVGNSSTDKREVRIMYYRHQRLSAMAE
jgi:hypothetical protein